MDLIWRKNRKKDEQQKHLVIQPSEEVKKYLDSIIQEKSFDVSKVIEYGHFGASLILKHDEANPEIKIRILKKQYVGENEKEWKKFVHPNILPLIKLEYLQNVDSYLFFSPAEESSLQEKIEDKLFRKDTQALRRIVNWLKEVTDAIQYLHSTGYTHLNIQSQNMIISKNDVLQISDFHYVSSRSSRATR